MSILKFRGVRSRLVALEDAIEKHDAVLNDWRIGLGDRLKAARLRALAPGFVHMSSDEARAAGRRMRSLLAAEGSKRWR